MQPGTRKLLDRSFSGVGLLAIAIMGATALLILTPIFRRGVGAYVFRGTVEHKRLLMDKFNQGPREEVSAEVETARRAREPIYTMLTAFKAELKEMPYGERRAFRDSLHEVSEGIAELLGPAPGEPIPVMPRLQYGQTRWDRALVKLETVLIAETWDYSNPEAMGVLVKRPRQDEFKGTSLEPLFDYLKTHLEEMLLPRRTFYWRFLTNKPLDAHIFGGILPEVLGTVYLTIGAMLFAVPLGIVAAVYFAEYAREGPLLRILRTCVGTLAGVPSIVFGLFGLAFFINTMGVSHSKSVLAGALTLGLLVLPMVIRASEEAIMAVPQTYKEAAMSVGAGRWHTVSTVILPAALPGILTGTVISMGRAAGETAPIIFTAAVSVGRALNPLQALSRPTPALSWNIYNLCTEHEAVDEIRHVQFGMVATLVGIVLVLNVAAIILRARISKRLRG